MLVISPRGFDYRSVSATSFPLRSFERCSLNSFTCAGSADPLAIPRTTPPPTNALTKCRQKPSRWGGSSPSSSEVEPLKARSLVVRMRSRWLSGKYKAPFRRIEDAEAEAAEKKLTNAAEG